jgi:hypothetical protein
VNGQTVLLVVGAVAEGSGIVLIGFPDVLPDAVRLSGWLRHHTRTVVNRLRRLIGLPPLKTIVSGSGVVEADVALRGSAVVGLKADATQEEQLAYLMRRDQDAQHSMNALAGRVVDLETQTPERLEELRKGMEAHVAGELASALEAYRPLRVLGTSALAIGLICVTTANFV